FLNDAALAPNGDAYITDSRRPVLFKIDGSGAQPGELESWLDFTGTPVQFTPGATALNGIVVSQDGAYIVVVHSGDQKLFRITVASKEVLEVDLGGTPQGGDGMVLDGQALYVLARTQTGDMIVRIQMAADFSSGVIRDSFRDDSFAFPTTIAKVGDRMLVVNSQFNARGAGQTPSLPFTVSDIPIPPLSSTPTSTPPPTPAEDFRFSGVIESMGTDTWVIGGQSFKLDQNTTLDSGLVVGVEARVEYRILVDGTSLALEIETDTPSSGTALPDSVRLELVAEGFTSPVGLIPSPDDTGRLFVADQEGTIWVLTPDGSLLTEPFLDLRSRMVSLNPTFDERGLLGLAFHPLFRENNRLFVYYSAPLQSTGPEGWDHTSHISEFRVMPGNPDRAAPASEKIILQVDEPQANHNAGQLAFGPDGFLYISLGDGGRANDTGLGHPSIGNGQDVSTLLGSILRIDIDGGDPYAIPPDNPFVGKEGRDEIFAFGLRNPFRMAFDLGGQHELFVGDVGQQLREEIDIVSKGGNYGWNIKEGTLCFDPENAGQPRQTCAEVDARGQPLIDPIIEYANSRAGGEGTAVIGGFVYRGAALPGMNGAYIFGDFSASGQSPDGRLFIAGKPASGGMWSMKELKVATNPDGRLNAFLRSFGQDASGELYVLVADPRGPEGKTGKIYRIVP
ncbi:MAG: PQQ-dependent sugar dehydrogenase, partial [Dehalococcoidales bacterium]|nr:PQQ-dependent sugar dehydrogenase [Dehalococcoidales bacterium]